MADQVISLSYLGYTETRQYNARLQMTRLSAPSLSVNGDAYNYDPWNRLVYRFITASSSRDDEEVTFRSTGVADVQFGGKRIEAAKQGVVVMDRLGTMVAAGRARRRFWPWGEERGETVQGRQKWATYWRTDDGINPGMDYAVNRFYQNGRFLTPDPYQASGGPGVPQSWNRYAYTRGDPVNLIDPSGLLDCGPEEDGCFVPFVPSSSDGEVGEERQRKKEAREEKSIALLGDALRAALEALKDLGCASLFNTDPGRPHLYSAQDVLTSMVLKVPLGGVRFGSTRETKLSWQFYAVTEAKDPLWKGSTIRAPRRTFC